MIPGDSSQAAGLSCLCLCGLVSPDLCGLGLSMAAALCDLLF